MDFDPSFKYPSLRSLTILPYNNFGTPKDYFTPARWQSLIAIFPVVTNFTLFYLAMDTFLAWGSIDEQTYPPEYPVRVKSPLWPTLHTFTLLGRHPKLNIALIRTAVSTRIASGQPIQKLQLSKAIMLMLTNEMQWLRTHLEVEECTAHPGLTSFKNWQDGNY